MTIRELLETPIGAMVGACLSNEPELKRTTPATLAKLRQFAAAEDISFEGMFCAMVNYMVTACDDAPSRFGNKNLDTDQTVN